MTRPQDPATYTPHFARRRGNVFCEGVSLEAIAKKVGTPAYVYSGAAISGAYTELDRALTSALGKTPHTICYAVKANSNLSVLRLLAKLGSGFDIVSGRRTGTAAPRGSFAEPSCFLRRWKKPRGNCRRSARRNIFVQRGIAGRTRIVGGGSGASSESVRRFPFE